MFVVGVHVNKIIIRSGEDEVLYDRTTKIRIRNLKSNHAIHEIFKNPVMVCLEIFSLT